MRISEHEQRITYKQPIRDYIGRAMQGSKEQVDYVPHTHLRIWHNTQTEGYAMHHHDAVEIIICDTGPYSVQVSETQYNLKPGDILYIPSNMPHSMTGGEGVRFIMLLDLSAFASFKDIQALDPLFLRPLLINDKLYPDLYDSVYNELQWIIRIYFQAADMWELSIFARLMKVLEFSGKYYFRSREPFSSASGNHSRINYEKFANLMSYIDTHYMENLTLEWAADYVGFSKYHFHRLFKEYAGTTFHDHLLRKRIQVAQLLLGSDLPITEVAFRSGFSGSTAFCRVFRSQTGMSPSDYKKKREKAGPFSEALYTQNMDLEGTENLFPRAQNLPVAP